MKRAILGLVVASLPAWAHVSGHGPLVEGKGPGGGALSAVISAKDAELGRDAKAIYYAETKLEAKRLEWKLLSAERKAFQAPKGVVTSAKLILFFEGDAKPAVIVAPLENGQVVYEVAEGKKLKGGEVIATLGDAKYVGDLALR